MEIKTYIDQRWSPRAFSEEKVKKEVLQSVFAAAGRAPSSFNEQPWRYIIGEKGNSTYDKILDCLNEWNQKWAISAPILILATAAEKFQKNGKDNLHAAYDLGASVAHLSMKAFEDELYLHQMAGFDAEKAISSFHIPKNFKAVCAIALGYQGDPAQLPQSIAETEKGVSERNAISTYVFGEEWEKTSQLVSE